tara:strand:+ start:348 stop:479 length:132 start_codon:yes stop_codon:yes gene_type:complete
LYPFEFFIEGFGNLGTYGFVLGGVGFSWVGKWIRVWGIINLSF